MTTMPKFNFKDLGVTDEELQAAKTKNSKFFEPGTFDAKVVLVEWSKQNENDPTWYSLKVTLQRDDRQIRTVVMVPTEHARFEKAGIKQPLFLFTKFQDFLASLGEKCAVDDIKTVVPKLFKKVEGLVGREVNITTGYRGPYIAYAGTKQYKIVEKDGRDFKGEGMVDSPVFQDRDSAIAEAATFGLDLSKTYVEVLTFNAREVSEDDETNPWGE